MKRVSISCDHSTTVKTIARISHECAYCFETSESRIFVCNSCGVSSCQFHSNLHFTQSTHSLYLSFKRTQSTLVDPVSSTLDTLHLPSNTPQFNVDASFYCFKCNSNTDHLIPDSLFVSLKNQPQLVQPWSLQITCCSHSLNLPSNPTPLSHPPKCNNCSLSDNLWLCLTCGNLGCGRQQFGGVGGNGHGINHYEQTLHPMSVKMGTITPEGDADVFCYTCGDEKIDPNLQLHLSTLGINIGSLIKTEKNLNELQLEQNRNFDFSMKAGDGQDFKLVYGPGLTGIKNLGNTCYIASVLQVLFSIPEFKQKYNTDSHFISCKNNPSNCFSCQIHKFAIGLSSGQFSVENTTVSPFMFKQIVGKDHIEFETMRQQDAQDYFLHLISFIQQKEMNGNVTSVFDLFVENRIQCIDCNRVKYLKSSESFLSLHVPSMSSVSLIDCLEHYFSDSVNEDWNCPNQKSKQLVSKGIKVVNFPGVLVVCLKRFIVGENYVSMKLNVDIDIPSRLDLSKFMGHGVQPDEELLDLEDESEQINVNQGIVDQLMQMGFPEIRAKKACIATNNSDADSAMMWLLDHMEDADIDDPIQSSGNLDASVVASLVDMGFTKTLVEKALKETNGDAERAVTWLFSHSDAPPPENVTDTGSTLYELDSFISHKGTSSACGHYVAYIKKEIGWVLFNDEKVAVIPNEEMIKAAKQAYMLFYRRC